MVVLAEGRRKVCVAPFGRLLDLDRQSVKFPKKPLVEIKQSGVSRRGVLDVEHHQLRSGRVLTSLPLLRHPAGYQKDRRYCLLLPKQRSM